MSTLTKVTTAVLAVFGVFAIVGFAVMVITHFSMMGNWAC
jgi:hypothetical protein